MSEVVIFVSFAGECHKGRPPVSVFILLMGIGFSDLKISALHCRRGKNVQKVVEGFSVHDVSRLCVVVIVLLSRLHGEFVPAVKRLVFAEVNRLAVGNEFIFVDFLLREFAVVVDVAVAPLSVGEFGSMSRFSTK